MRQSIAIVGSCILLPFLIASCATHAPLSGAELYAANCATCHGRYADGEGPASADLGGRVPDLRYLTARNGGVYPRTHVIDIIDGRSIVKAHGERTMPVWGDAFAQMEAPNKSAQARANAKIQALADYLATIQKSG